MDPYQLPQALRESGHHFVVWYSIETVFNIATIVNGTVMVMAFLRSHLLHIYFRTVCINVFVLALIRSAFRIVIFVIAVTTKSETFMFYLSCVVLFFNLVLNFAQTSIIIERLWSSFCVDVYESLKSRKVVVAFLGLPSLLSFILMFLLFTFQLIPAFVFKWGSILLNTSLWISFYGFLKYNTWKQSKARRSWKLNIRYQQKENRRISVTMVWFGCYCSVQSLFMSAYTLWNTYDVRSQIYEMEGSLFLVADVVFNLIFTLSTALYPLPFIITIGAIKIYYFRTLCCVTGFNNKVNPVTVVDGYNDREYHFQQLKHQWDEVQ